MQEQERAARMQRAQMWEECRLWFADHRVRGERALRTGIRLFVLKRCCQEWQRSWPEIRAAAGASEQTARKQIALVRLFLAAPRFYQNLRHLRLSELYRLASLGLPMAAETYPEAAVDGFHFSDDQPCLAPMQHPILAPDEEEDPPPPATIEELRELTERNWRERVHTVDLGALHGRMLLRVLTMCLQTNVDFEKELTSLGVGEETARRSMELGLLSWQARNLFFALRPRGFTLGEMYELAGLPPEDVLKLHPEAAAEPVSGPLPESDDDDL
jgi:hypothetical protein